MVLRMYWDGDERPSVEVPLGDFFGLGWDAFAPLSSKYVVSAPYCALNTYWPMPFRGQARVTVENLTSRAAVLYYYIDYGLGEIPDDSMYFHATWHRDNPVKDGIHHVLRAAGPGKYVGTYMAVGVNHPGWWGEGEVKFYIDGDSEFPTICGTGTEDFFGGAWDFEVPGVGYSMYSAPYLGLHQVIGPDGLYNSQQRFGMYRWHELDPVTFDTGLRVDVQDLGWLQEGENPSRGTTSPPRPCGTRRLPERLWTPCPYARCWSAPIRRGRFTRAGRPDDEDRQAFCAGSQFMLPQHIRQNITDPAPAANLKWAGTAACGTGPYVVSGLISGSGELAYSTVADSQPGLV